MQPDGRGPLNPAGVDFYKRLVAGLRERGIEPVATLYHWDLPSARQAVGGWASRRSGTDPDRFLTFHRVDRSNDVGVAVAAAALGDRAVVRLDLQWIRKPSGGEG